MNKFLFFIFFYIFFIFIFTNAQQTLNSWTWISGSNSIDQNGVYGTKGISNISNIPGARFYSISWIDSNNNLWLFGGKGYSSNTLGNEIKYKLN